MLIVIKKYPGEPKHGVTSTRRFLQKNKRGIAGTLIWVNFDRHGLLDLAASATIDALSGVVVNSVSGLKEVAKPWYSDQVLPFDITLQGVNEQGAATAMRIFGVEILNEGSGVSINDAVTEMQATFVARFVEPWNNLVLRRAEK